MDDLLIYDGTPCSHKKFKEGDLVQILDGYDIRNRGIELYPEGVIGIVEVAYERGTRPIGVKPYNFKHRISMFWYEKSQLCFIGRNDE